MPVVDSRLGIIIADAKPKRRCAWSSCPHDWPEGCVMKACARCRLIRYCSKPCQVADWPQHKTVCQEPRALDINAWILEHEAGFKWAAAQALGGFSGPNRTLTHRLMITVLRADRVAAKSVAGPFIMLGVRLAPMYEYSAGYSPRENAEIRRNGGIGLAIASFKIDGMPGGRTVMLSRQWVLRRPSPAATSRGFFPNWEEIAKNVVNDTLEDAELLHMINNWEPSADAGSGVIEEVE